MSEIADVGKTEFAISLIPVEFVYHDKEGIANRRFNGLCLSVPRVGDKVFSGTPDEFTVVCEVAHKFYKIEPTDSEFHQTITVLLRDSRQDDLDRTAAEFHGQ